MKKALAILLAVMMVFGLCGLASAESPVAKAADTWAEKWADVDTSQHVVINYMTTGDAPTTGANEEMLAALNEILTEKANAELNIVWVYVSTLRKKLKGIGADVRSMRVWYGSS